ncbi:ABC transporter substrate-binding protein [Virgibacillus phasianinus]|uniref:ABC transporter substrate-binding protein n=1 Tax=Virgibacillus phasianinus TaxID=2017483 RepID=A0A220TZD1_9BACI|nr:ABC transporter substrate-binding protein [Virgibacillus phasianinus]ASK61021.1 ABC transporter substrate-binding protein [Virgibacillus phasianinus]
MKKIVFVLCCALILILTACNKESETSKTANKQELQEVSIVLDWTPNTNHTGIYVAQEKGYFTDQGLDVEIVMPGEVGAEQLVASGKADFGVSYQEGVTQARVQGVPIVSIAAVIQHNTSGFASPKEKGIDSLKEFEGKTYGGFGAPVEKAVLSSLMKDANADIDQVDIVNMGNTDFFTAVKRDIDFSWIYYGWTGIEAELRDVDLNMLYLTDYSKKLDYYTPVLATNEKMIKEHPDTVKKFIAAVSKGYEFAIDKPDKSAQILIDAVPDLDAELVKASQKWLSPKYQADATKWGVQKLEVWENYAKWMYENDLLDHKLDSEAAFTNEFLPKKEGE